MSEPYTTSDLSIAAFILAGNHLSLLQLDVSEPKRVKFIFEDGGGEGPKLEAAFTAGATVPANAYHYQLRVLRRRIEDSISRNKKRGSDGQINSSSRKMNDPNDCNFNR